MNIATGELSPEDGEQIAELFARWAADEGMLLRVTEAQCANLAKAFAVGFAFGAAVSAQNQEGESDAR